VVNVALEDGSTLRLTLENLLGSLGKEGAGWLCGPTETAEEGAGNTAEEDTTGSVFSVVVAVETSEDGDEAFEGAREVWVGEGAVTSGGNTTAVGLRADVEVGLGDTTVPNAGNGASLIGDQAQVVVGVERSRGGLADLSPGQTLVEEVTEEPLTSEARVVVKEREIILTVDAVIVLEWVTGHVPETNRSDTLNGSLHPTSAGEHAKEGISSDASVQQTTETAIALLGPGTVPVGVASSGKEGQDGA